MCKKSLFVVAALCFSSSLLAEECPPTPELVIKTNDIFDLNDPETIWLHKLANALNFVTKPYTIRNELAFLKEKCGLNEQDLQEIERHLRTLKYIRSAEASFTDDGKVAVETSDKWTLMPTFDFGRKGGKNKFSIGLKERNLFGYGIDAEIEYFKDAQRSGYILDTNFPLFMGYNIHSNLSLSNTDDGSTQGISVVKPFVSFDTQTAFEIAAYNADLTQQYFLNGQDYFALDYTEKLARASWGQLYSRSPDSVLRYQVGVDYSQRLFNQVISDYDIFLPSDREYLVPFVQFEYLEDDFHELNNVHVINQIEDFNFGWRFMAKLGVNVASRSNDESRYILDFEASKGTQLSESTLLLTNMDFVSNFGSTDSSRYVMNLENELFYRLSPKFGLYAAQHLTLSKNPYLDEPITIGEESGVRGYPLEFQRGHRKFAFTGELRYYPDINIYNLFELGGAVFVDTGKASGLDEFDNQEKGWLSSVGIGARLYSRHASDTKVIHIDMSFPMISGEHVNNVEFLVTTKSNF
ncbi:hypothetical protein KIH87_13520 [Paraneptunicella aestuarii]|uniref:hypothetical protein n=1 Tax=Paraneptunicella aestuarii TaxID=2831148 RepID=UPI001E2D06E9|nr:hypothetical protein [Paraneptunicella aestuarii]UAA37722.1 hypothetical protein KIH87_13520 [Paraneptunicella aestuarii]